ncbi:hypothetical protein F5B18DRAFT_105140 [Nemania serpens]|nr:hypothetical protein F5B18DRAFT_105140 [Nemania serpens]
MIIGIGRYLREHRDSVGLYRARTSPCCRVFLVYDIIIVGGGTTSCVLANRLSENRELQVLVIEAWDDLTADPRANHPSMGLPTSYMNGIGSN